MVDDFEKLTIASDKPPEELLDGLSTDDSAEIVADENINTIKDDSIELLVNASKQFIEQFKDAPIEQRQAALIEFYEVIDAVYDIKYRGESVPLVFSETGDDVFNQDDGFIRISLKELMKQTPNEAAFSILHEYRHAMQPSIGVEKKNQGLETFTIYTHDTLPQEIDATKFAFETMDIMGINKEEIGTYERWQAAIRQVDTFNILKQDYSPEIANNVSEIYRLIDEYDRQTNRSDWGYSGAKERFTKIQIKLRFSSNLPAARQKLREVEKIAKTTNDDFLLKIVSNIRADWPKYL